MTSDILTSAVELGQESPLKREFDAFDIANIDWGATNYKLNALKTPIQQTTQLLVKDWRWRKEHGQNVVASIDGIQGSGKSMPFSYVGLLLGTIFGVPFTPNDIYFSVEELDEAIQHSVSCQTFFKDEDPKTRVGLMSHMLDANITDYEEQLRLNQNNMLQAGVELRTHAHFFWFESKHILFDNKGYPTSFITLLKTPRYTDRKEFVWRGLISFPMPNPGFVKQYLERKKQHNEHLKAKYGNTLNPVAYYARQIFEKRGTDLIKKTKEGFISPIKKELMDFIVAEEIGTRRFTVSGYDHLVAQLRDMVSKKYEKENEEIIAAFEALAELKSKQRKDQKLAELEISEKRRNAKLSLMKKKLREEKRRNDLKEKQFELNKQALEQSNHKV